MSFDYLPGWSVGSDDDLGHGVRFVSLDGPSESILTLSIVPESAAKTLDEYAEFEAENRNNAPQRAQFPLGPLSSTHTQGRIAGADVPGIEQRYTRSGHGVTMPFINQLFTLSLGEKRLYVDFQVAAVDLDATRPGVVRVFETLRPPRH